MNRKKAQEGSVPKLLAMELHYKRDSKKLTIKPSKSKSSLPASHQLSHDKPDYGPKLQAQQIIMNVTIKPKIIRHPF
jgi:hypothetical protein